MPKGQDAIKLLYLTSFPCIVYIAKHILTIKKQSNQFSLHKPQYSAVRAQRTWTDQTIFFKLFNSRFNHQVINIYIYLLLSFLYRNIF